MVSSWNKNTHNPGHLEIEPRGNHCSPEAHTELNLPRPKAVPHALKADGSCRYFALTNSAWIDMPHSARPQTTDVVEQVLPRVWTLIHVASTKGGRDERPVNTDITVCAVKYSTITQANIINDHSHVGTSAEEHINTIDHIFAVTHKDANVPDNTNMPSTFMLSPPTRSKLLSMI